MYIYICKYICIYICTYNGSYDYILYMIYVICIIHIMNVYIYLYTEDNTDQNEGQYPILGT